MSESKMRADEIKAKVDAANHQSQQNAQATKHMTDMGSVTGTYVNHISGCMTVDGLFRVAAGEILHPAVPGRFSIGLNMPPHVFRAFHEMSGTLLKQYDEMIAKGGAPKPPEATIKTDTFDSDNSPHQMASDEKLN